ncbi:MAG: arginine--tRNA ligase [Chloroflexi bacterium]|nr:arginine--tRNA ligase [Chloroflexota bacterium]
MNLLPIQIAALIRDALLAAQAAGDLPPFALPETIPVQRSNKPELADYACPVAMPLAKTAGLKPLDIAQAIARHVPPADFLESVTAAPPGFLNIRLSNRWVMHQIDTIIAAGENVFALDLGTGQKAQVECVSANPTGPITVGRTRGGVIGSTMANVLAALGYQVEMEYYFNNAGRQMQLLGHSLQARYRQELGLPAALPEEGYQGDYLISMAKDLVAKYDKALANEPWERFKQEAETAVFAWIERSLARIGIRFDHFFNENSVYENGKVWEVLKTLEDNGYAYRAVNREGATPDEIAKTPANAKEAIWFRSTRLGDKEDRVIVKASGEPTYVLPDIAYHMNKLDRGFSYLINVLGADHIVEAQSVARGLQAVGYDPKPVHVLLHQFVTLFEGGKQKRMSTRKGEYVTLDELVEDVGPDVVRYFILARSADAHLEFDLDLARQQANENPVYYIQNAHVRCAGIFRQTTERGLTDEGADLSLLGDREQAFVRKMLEMLEMLVQTHEEVAPHKLAFFAHDLARMFHPMYDEVRVLHGDVPEDVAKARLRLYRAAQIVFKRLLTLMGMSAPDVM